MRVQAGTTVELFGTGFDFELGVYADLIEYVATIGTTDTCELSITESVDCNIGAFAHAVVELDYKTFGAAPGTSFWGFHSLFRSSVFEANFLRGYL